MPVKEKNDVQDFLDEFLYTEKEVGKRKQKEKEQNNKSNNHNDFNIDEEIKNLNITDEDIEKEFYELVGEDNKEVDDLVDFMNTPSPRKETVPKEKSEQEKSEEDFINNINNYQPVNKNNSKEKIKQEDKETEDLINFMNTPSPRKNPKIDEEQKKKELEENEKIMEEIYNAPNPKKDEENKIIDSITNNNDLEGIDDIEISDEELETEVDKLAEEFKTQDEKETEDLINFMNTPSPRKNPKIDEEQKKKELEENEKIMEEIYNAPNPKKDEENKIIDSITNSNDLEGIDDIEISDEELETEVDKLAEEFKTQDEKETEDLINFMNTPSPRKNPKIDEEQKKKELDENEKIMEEIYNAPNPKKDEEDKVINDFLNSSSTSIKTDEEKNKEKDELVDEIFTSSLSERKDSGLRRSEDGFVVNDSYGVKQSTITRDECQDIYNNARSLENDNNKIFDAFLLANGTKDATNDYKFEKNGKLSSNFIINNLEKGKDYKDNNEIKQYNLNREKAGGKMLTAEVLTETAAIYKVQYDKHYNKSPISRFFGYFSKENRQERENLKKMENYFMSKNISKETISKFQKGQAIEVINKQIEDKKLYSEKDFNDFFEMKQNKNAPVRKSIEVGEAKVNLSRNNLSKGVENPSLAKKNDKQLK